METMNTDRRSLKEKVHETARKANGSLNTLRTKKKVGFAPQGFNNYSSTRKTQRKNGLPKLKNFIGNYFVDEEEKVPGRNSIDRKKDKDHTSIRSSRKDVSLKLPELKNNGIFTSFNEGVTSFKATLEKSSKKSSKGSFSKRKINNSKKRILVKVQKGLKDCSPRSKGKKSVMKSPLVPIVYKPMDNIKTPGHMNSPKRGLNLFKGIAPSESSFKDNLSFNKNHKLVRKIKKNLLNTRRITQQITDSIRVTNDESDSEYYKKIQDGVEIQSMTSLYASTPDNKNELKPDDLIAGEEAIHNMHSKFKKYRRIKEKEEFEGKEPKYPLVQFIDAADRRNILPKPIGLINKSPQMKKYPLESVKSIFVGKDYAFPFSEGIQIINKLKDLDLSCSDLGNGMLIPILKKLPTSLEKLDVSSNRNFSDKVYHIIASLLEDKDRSIKSLSLDNTNLNDKNLEIIHYSLIYASSLESLDLSRNKLSDEGAIILSDIISSNTTLKTLLIHWNKIMAKGGIAIAHALKGNSGIETFDVSFNNFGGGFDDNKCSQAFKSCFKENKTLAHIDISFCGLNQEEIIIINEGLSENHTIWGIHCLGNAGKVDQMGYLVPFTLRDDPITYTFSRIKGELQAGLVPKEQVGDINKTNCWICEGWVAHKFEFTPGISTEEPINNEKELTLHAEFDNYHPDLLLADEAKSGTFSSYRMIPPLECKYYFMNEDEAAILAADLPQQECMLIDEDRKLDKVNVLANLEQNKCVYDQEYRSKQPCIPRPPPKFMVKKERIKTPWDFFKSVFKDYKPDTPTLLEGCFEYDWKCSKITKLVKNEEDQAEVKKILKSHYKEFREVYKFQGALNPAGLYPSIGSNVISEIVASCKHLVDNSTLNLSDIDLEFVATNAGNKNNPRNPERQLVRYQLMEYFVRIAKSKFIRNKICDTFGEAVKKIYDEHLKEFFEKYDCHKWRTTYLWNEHCDYVFKRYMPAIKKVYEKFSGRFALPGATKYMSSEEFFDLIDIIGVVSDDFGQREISPIFNCSMMTQKDELESDRHINMTLIEFIEAIGRLAYKIKLPIPFEYLNLIFDEMVNENTSMENQPLFISIETLIVQMIKCCLKKDFAETFLENMEKYYKDQYNAPKRTRYAHIGGPY
ncbi:unnamed protein product [Moneuplotes crassus]|uniref:Uncharacterized protein n=2 Tax=Euplotes crassus TaxID=5936 RepID=A0AAD1UAQ8_EUPCR|nr:unnamed protein product [Moneuplotes crassus]